MGARQPQGLGRLGGQLLGGGAHDAPGPRGDRLDARGALGGRDLSRWLAGGPNPEGKGKIPNITPAHLSWSTDEIAEYLKTGFTPDYDSAGGSMAEVVTNLSHLPDADRQAIAAYLAKVPPIP